MAAVAGELGEVCRELREVAGLAVTAATAAAGKGAGDSFSQLQQQQLAEAAAKGALLMLELRELNRRAYMAAHEAKEKTAAARKSLDHAHLGLAALMYERDQLAAEINACRSFRTAYPDVDAALAPASASPTDPQQPPSSPHNAMLARLSKELQDRQSLAARLESLKARKKAMKHALSARSKFLQALPAQLEALKAASQPLQEQLKQPHAARSAQRRLASLLPAPLYLLYLQLSAYHDAFDANIRIGISGDASTAAAELESDEVAEQTGMRLTVDTAALSDEQLYRTHPLSVELHVSDDHDAAAELLVVSFRFLPRLHVIGVASSFPDGSSASLANLFPNDTGEDTPNQASKLLHNGAFMFDGQFPSRPFRWAQHLAGLDFLDDPSASGMLGSIEALAAHRQQQRCARVVEQLRNRARALQAIQAETAQLLKLNIPNTLLKYTPQCKLTEFTEVELYLEYPTRAPSFHLSLLRPASPHPYTNELAAIEAEVNAHIWEVVPAEQRLQLLTQQVARLMQCIDLVFGGVSAQEMGLRAVRGRDRRKALVPNGGAFDHRV
eukprot:jgi/Chlat1/7340/Chrsp59S06968